MASCPTCGGAMLTERPHVHLSTPSPSEPSPLVVMCPHDWPAHDIGEPGHPRLGCYCNDQWEPLPPSEPFPAEGLRAPDGKAIHCRPEDNCAICNERWAALTAEPSPAEGLRQAVREAIDYLSSGSGVLGVIAHLERALTAEPDRPSGDLDVERLRKALDLIGRVNVDDSEAGWLLYAEDIAHEYARLEHDSGGEG